MINPKLEIRNSKQIQISKIENPENHSPKCAGAPN
jgi:hypothetical protein